MKNFLSYNVAKLRISEIEIAKQDNEIAHGMEDSLYLEFIENIHHSKYKDISEIKKIAGVLLKSQKIEFERWMA